MGDNLELICLFQAAEIERLIDNLDQYKLKYNLLDLDTKKLKRNNQIVIHMRFRSESQPQEQNKMKA